MKKYEIIRQDTYKLEIEVKDASGSAIDLSGGTMTFTLRSNTATTATATDTNSVKTKTLTTFTDGTNGRTDLILDGDDTNLEPDTYSADVQFKTADNPPKRFSTLFQVAIIPDVSRV